MPAAHIHIFTPITPKAFGITALTFPSLKSYAYNGTTYVTLFLLINNLKYRTKLSP